MAVPTVGSISVNGSKIDRRGKARPKRILPEDVHSMKIARVMTEEEKLCVFIIKKSRLGGASCRNLLYTGGINSWLGLK